MSVISLLEMSVILLAIRKILNLKKIFNLRNAFVFNKSLNAGVLANSDPAYR